MHPPIAAGAPEARRQRAHVVTLPSHPDAVFPLLCPTREYEWIPTWRCEMRWSRTGFAELDGIFETTFPGEGPVTWITIEHDPSARRVAFLCCHGLDRIARYTLEVEPAEGGSRLAVAQVLTALTPGGLEAQARDDDSAWVKMWDELAILLVEATA